MITKSGNRIVSIVVGGCVAAAFFVSLSTFGQRTLRSAIGADAERRANQWLALTLQENRGDLTALLSGQLVLPHDHSGGVDAIAVIGKDGYVVPVSHTNSDHLDDLRMLVSQSRQSGKTGNVLRDGAHVPAFLSWFSASSLKSWVLLPISGQNDKRLAVRVPQSQIAATLAGRIRYQLAFSLGIAVITFGSFMAGYRFRRSRLHADSEEMRFLALHDELTGLPNRKQFEDRLSAAVTAANEKDHRCAVFILDLDGFKNINDTLGHLVGDELLCRTAERLSTSLRDSDMLARLSGDEFAVIIPKIHDVAQITPMADRILELMADPIPIDGHEIQIGCSVGIAVAPDNGDTPIKVMRNADFALYRAKSEGKRTWRFFNPKMAEDLKSRRMMEDGLRYALEKDLFALLYQPQFNLETGEVAGYEALLRWSVPGRGLIPTAMFLSVAEETGLIVPMGEWVINRAIADCRRFGPGVRIAINLSPAQLKRDGLEEFITQALRDNDVDASQIEIEVNESILGRNEVAAFEKLEKIREIGVSIVMDNFGVGTSSLGLLSRYPFDKIKVDRSFMNNIDDDQKSRAVVAAICNLGRSLGMAVAGEGVESGDHAAILRAAGCQQGQGYYFGRPQSLEDILGVPVVPRFEDTPQPAKLAMAGGQAEA